MRRTAIGDADLLAYVDGELDEAASAAVRAHLRANAADAGRVETWRRQNAAIRRAFDLAPRANLPPIPARPSGPSDPGRAGTPVAARLDLVRAARQRRRTIATLGTFLGGASVALLGAVAWTRAGPSPDRLPAAVEVEPFVPAAQARRARVAWRTFSRDMDGMPGDRLPTSALLHATALPRVPDLSHERFMPIAARLMPGDAEPAAFLLYESPAAVRVALTVERTGDADSAPVAVDDGKLRSLSWRAGGYAVALVGPAEPETLRTLARATAAAFAGR